MDIEKKVLVDGQEMIIPSLSAWNDVLENPIYKRLPVYGRSTENIVRNLISLVARYSDDFCLGLYKTKHIEKSWSVMPLLKCNAKLYRVHIEYVSCLSCDWRGRIANPIEPSLYFTVPNGQSILHEASTLSQLPCPECGAKLPTYAIWTE